MITYAGEEGDLKLASGSVSKGDAKAFTTFTVLYDLLQYLGLDLPAAMKNKAIRPFDDVLEESYVILNKRIDDILEYCGNIRPYFGRGLGKRRAQRRRTPRARDIRSCGQSSRRLLPR